MISEPFSLDFKSLHPPIIPYVNLCYWDFVEDFKSNNESSRGIRYYYYAVVFIDDDNYKDCTNSDYPQGKTAR